MEFIDSTGHIFSLPSYEDNPINLEYVEGDYIFWLKDSSVSINNYYIKPVRFLLNEKIIKNSIDENDNNIYFKLEISNSSQFYKLISPKYLQSQLEKSNSISDSVGLDKSEFKDILTLDDFYFDATYISESPEVEDTVNLVVTSDKGNKFYMFPFYVVGYSDIEGTFLNNIMITYSYGKEKTKTNYTPITVGCSFIDECEELIINGRNMGIRLPKEILKAIYSSSFYSVNADEKLLKNKLKELLLNYMNIKGETGNVKSMMNSLKWFGWNKHINISKLIKTDNEFQNQFILDYFDIKNDIKETFKYFNRTNNISLTVLGNQETGETYQQNYDEVFLGEGKPKLEDLFAKNVEVVKDDITFYKPYYNFVFNELALKLDCLKYYYQQYFLPVHININRASIAYKVYANTTKLSTVGFTTITDKPLYLPSVSDNIRVTFPDTNRLLFMQSNHIIDDKFNEFSNYNDSNPENLYYVNENCVTIPITIAYDDYMNNHYEKVSEYYFNCNLILTATIIKQNRNGHYIKMGEKYIYKNSFYSTSFVEKSNSADENYNYIKYYGEYVKIDPTNRYDIKTIYLIKDNHFNYYQTNDQYYMNFILIPRLLNNNIDYENAYFRLSLLVNNKWFNYDFRIVTPNIYLDLGKLEYKYALTNGENNYYPFKQLKSLSPLKFNSFMYEPDLITINGLFKEKNKNKLLTFLDKLLETDDGTHNADQYKMYEFYKKYYSNALIIPYNTKYYNRIHIFNIYDNNGKEISCKDQIGINSSKYLTQGFVMSQNDGERLYNSIKTYFKDNENIKYFKYLYIHLNKSIMIEEDDTIEYYPSKNSYNYILLPVSNNIDYNIFNNPIDNGYNNPDNTYKLNINNCLIIKKFKNFNDNYLNEECKNDFIDFFQNIHNKYDVNYTGVDWIYYDIEYIEKINENYLYSDFFNSDCTCKILLNESVIYDYYLMHDDSKWYMVAISQYPIASYPDGDLLNINQKVYTLRGDNNTYTIQYADYSIDKFLVNRMVIKKSNGINQFNKDDLIIVGVNNNDYQFNIDLNNKWTVQPIYDINDVYDVNSNTNLTIITNNNQDNLYTPGYYNVKLQYTINGLNNILHNSIAQYRILDKYQDIKYPEIKEPVIIEEIVN